MGDNFIKGGGQEIEGKKFSHEKPQKQILGHGDGRNFSEVESKSGNDEADGVHEDEVVKTNGDGDRKPQEEHW